MNKVAFEDAVETENGWTFKVIFGPFPTKEDADAAAILLSMQFNEAEDKPAPLGVIASDGIQAGEKIG